MVPSRLPAALLLLWSTPAMGQAPATDHPPETPAGTATTPWPLVATERMDLPVKPGIEEGVLFVLEDRGDLLQGDAPWGRTTGDGGKTESRLRDDGTSADAVAGDRVYTLHITSLPLTDMIVEVVDARGVSYWADSGPRSTFTSPAILEMRLQDGKLLVAPQLKAGKPADSAAAPPPPATDREPEATETTEAAAKPPPGEATPPSGEAEATPPRDPAREGTFGKAWFIAGFAAFGLIIGLLLGWLRQRTPRPASRLQPIGTPPAPWNLRSIGPLPEGPAPILVCPDSPSRLSVAAALLREASAHLEVLLVATPEDRRALADLLGPAPGVHAMQNPSPSAEAVARTVADARRAGDTLVVVLGLGALEPPLEDEPASAVLTDLASRVPGGPRVVCLVSADEPGAEQGRPLLPPPQT